MSSRADQLLADAPAVELGELFAGLAAAVADPAGEPGAAALHGDFVADLGRLAGLLGLELPSVPAGEPAFDGGVDTEYVRLFVNGRRGPACPPWASYFLEDRLAGAAALRLHDVAAPAPWGGAGLEDADGAVGELARLALLLLDGRRAEARAYLGAHLEPWMARFAARLAAEARLPQHVLAAAIPRGAVRACGRRA